MRAALLGACLAACTPLDEIEVAWNHVYAVDAMREGEGCDPPADAAEPSAPYLGIGYARALPDTVSIYWCPETDECTPTPWATFWVEDPTVRAIAGARGQSSVTGGRLCSLGWDGAQATQKGNKLTLDVQQYAATIEVGNEAECDSILESVFETTCTTSRSFEATRVP